MFSIYNLATTKWSSIDDVTIKIATMFIKLLKHIINKKIKCSKWSKVLWSWLYSFTFDDYVFDLNSLVSSKFMIKLADILILNWSFSSVNKLWHVMTAILKKLKMAAILFYSWFELFECTLMVEEMEIWGEEPEKK